jgi:hypothetical protein
LIPDQKRQPTSQEQEKESGPKILKTDHLVVVGPKILPEERLLGMMLVPGSLWEWLLCNSSAHFNFDFERPDILGNA